MHDSRVAEKVRKIKGYGARAFHLIKVVSSAARYDHFDTLPNEKAYSHDAATGLSKYTWQRGFCQLVGRKITVAVCSPARFRGDGWVLTVAVVQTQASQT